MPLRLAGGGIKGLCHADPAGCDTTNLVTASDGPARAAIWAFFARRGAAMNDLEQAVLFGFSLLAAALVGNAVMAAFGVASPILGMAEGDAIIWIKKLIAGLVN